MSFLKNEKGQALVIVTICMSILMGMAGLAIEIGLLYRTRQNVQTAADAAAEAAALDYYYNSNSTNAQLQGAAAATLNGFTDGVSGASVTINLPPTSGPVSGNSKYAEAIVTYPNPVSFMGLFGYKKVNVTARAVAGRAVPGDACIWLLGTSGTDLTLQGSYNVQTPGCGIYVNSSDSQAVKVIGGGGTVNAAFLDVVGNVTPQHQTTPTPITSGVAPRTTPVSPPNAGTCTKTITNAQMATSGQMTPSDVTALIGSSPTGVICFSGSVTLTNGVNLPGAQNNGVLYNFQNGVTIATGATVNVGSCPACNFTVTPPVYDDTPGDIYGATMYLQSGTLTQNSNSLLSLYAPTMGNYNGVALMQPSTNSTTLQIQFGSNNQVLDGYIYAPNAEVDLHDSGGGDTATGIIAKTMVNQTSQINIPSYNQFHFKSTPVQIITLVE